MMKRSLLALILVFLMVTIPSGHSAPIHGRKRAVRANNVKPQIKGKDIADRRSEILEITERAGARDTIGRIVQTAAAAGFASKDALIAAVNELAYRIQNGAGYHPITLALEAYANKAQELYLFLLGQNMTGDANTMMWSAINTENQADNLRWYADAAPQNIVSNWKNWARNFLGNPGYDNFPSHYI